MKISNSVISLFLSGFFRWNSTSQKVPLSIEIELWGRVSKTVLMSYSEKSPQMQNWPSVWPKNSWGAGDGQQQQTFSFLLWDILGFDYGVIKEFNFNVTFSYSSKSKQKIWTTKLRKTLLKFFWLENFTEKKSLGNILCKDEVLTQFWWFKKVVHFVHISISFILLMRFFLFTFCMCLKFLFIIISAHFSFY